MVKKPSPAEPAKRFLSDIDEDEITGGGIPDEDGWVYMQRQQKAPRKQPAKAAKKRPKKPRKG